MKSKWVVFYSIIFAFIGLSYGILAGTFEIFPYDVYNKAKQIIFSELDRDYPEKDAYVYEQDVSSLIKIKTSNDVITKRNLLIDFIWNGENFPSSQMPTFVKKNISDERFNDMKNLKQINKFEIEMEYGVNSIVYHFVPEQTKNKAIIYHQGHAGDFINGKSTIQFFLENDYDVVAFAMPLLGLNSQPIIELEQFGSIRLSGHQHFRLLETDDFTPMKFFLEPLAVSLNYLEEEYDFEEYYMIGLSGGGLLTAIYPAIDDRISHGYSVAGSYPIFLEATKSGPWHYEYLLKEFYEIVNYLEIYVMAGYGENRKFVQIFNEFDLCCYEGDYYTIYEDELKNTMNNLGKGEYDVYLDSTHKEHKISEHALEVIQNSIEENVS